MYIYHALINALIAHMIHINLNMLFYTHVEHSPTKTTDIKYYMEKKQQQYISMWNDGTSVLASPVHQQGWAWGG